MAIPAAIPMPGSHGLLSLANAEETNPEETEAEATPDGENPHVGAFPSSDRPLPPPDLIIEAVTKELLARTGRQPETEAIVSALNRATVGLLYDGKSPLAERVARTALQRAEAALGEEHPSTLASFNNLANLHSLQGRFEAAEPLLARALRIGEQALGKEHPGTLASLNGLAFLYDAQGRFHEAEPLLVRVFAVRARLLGDEHADTRRSAKNLAQLYFAQGRYEETESLYERALRIDEGLLGEGHPDALDTRLNLAVTRINRRKFALALADLHWTDAHLGTVIDALLVNTREVAARQRWFALQSHLHNVVFSLALLGPEADPDAALPLAVGMLPDSRRLAGENPVLVAHLARTGRARRAGGPARSSPREITELARILDLPASDPEAASAALAKVEEIKEELAPLGYAYLEHRVLCGEDWPQIEAVLPPGAALLSVQPFHPMDFKTGKAGEAHWLGVAVPTGPADGAEAVLRDLGPVASVPPTPAQAGKTKTAAGESTRRRNPVPFGKLGAAFSGYRHLYIVLNARAGIDPRRVTGNGPSF